MPTVRQAMRSKRSAFPNNGLLGQNNINVRHFSMITRIDHLGIAVKSIDEALPYYEKALGLRCEHREEVPSQKVRTAFFTVGEVHLELLEPTSPESPIAKFLEKNPSGGIHHIAFASSDINGQLKQAAGTGVKLLHEVPFEGAANKLVAFLHPKSTFGVLTEFCMPKQ
jgi:methylmalonyl-CoA/ethylmalonyl-CoA epimerase